MPLIVNGEPVDDALVREEARLLRPRYEELVTGLDPIEAEMQLREWARENVIERVLLRQEALRDSQPVPAEAVSELLNRMKNEAGGQVGCGMRTSDDELRAEAETRLRIERLVSSIGAKAARPKNKEVSEFYKKHQNRFYTPELVHVKHIVKNVGEHQDEATASAAIAEVLAKLQDGATFEEVADQASDCPGRGGDLGWFQRGEMVEEFDAVVFQLEPGQTSEIFRTVFGFHVARMYGRKPAGVRSLAEVRPEIEQLIAHERREQALAEFLDRARERAVIQLNAKAIG